MHGSAAVIGLQMLPVLGTVVPREEAAPHAAALGVAFQLTNFLRDVGEDLDRGRVYLPADLLAAHGVDRPLLRVEPPHRAPRPADHRRAASAADGHDPRRVPGGGSPASPCSTPVSRPCIRTAFVLYGGILDAVARRRLHRAAPPCGGVPRRRAAAAARRAGPRSRAARCAARAGARRAAASRRGAPRGGGRDDATGGRPLAVPLRLRRGPRLGRQAPTWREARPGADRRRR